MSSFHYISEIVESKEEQGPFQKRNVEHHRTRVLKADGKGEKSVLKSGISVTHDDDLNKLFAAINFKISSEGLSPRYIGPEALRKLKKPMIVASPPSTLGISEPVTLKQALRGLCISQASEMAAMKRISKPNSPIFSDTPKLKSFCKSAKVEPGDPHSDAEELRGDIPFASRGRIPIPQVPKTEQVYTIPASPLSVSRNGSPRTVTTSGSTPSSDIRVKPLSNIKSMAKEDILPKKESGPISGNIREKDVPAKSTKKGKILTSPSIPFKVNVTKAKHASKSSQYMMKLVPPSKGILKKKQRQQDLSSQSNTGDHKEEPDIIPDVNHMVCQKCQCALNTSVDMKSGMTNVVSYSGNFGSDFKANESTGMNDSRPNKSDKLSEKCELSQSSQSSLGEYSSCTSVSGESNLSRPSCSNRPHMSKDVRWKAIRQVRSKYRVLGLENFSLIKKLGCGDIGTVYLAELIGSNCLFAIKVMDIEYLERRKKTNRAETERMILKILDHPFLPTLYAHFTSENLSCLVMEYCPGGDLHVLRQKQADRNFSENAARFYAAEVLLALEYLHMLGVVYRDLKPENILVREDGHIMLTDFDLSLRCTVSPTLLLKSPPLSLSHSRVDPPAPSCIEPFCSDPSFKVPSCFSPRFLPPVPGRRIHLPPTRLILPLLVAEPTDARSNSFVGTHEYLAPEIIKGEGHGSAVDWWTFGIFLYELLYGKTPFKGCGNEETLGRVVSYGLRFPDTPTVSGLARSLITGLLVKDPVRRLGSERGAAEIKRHPFFEGLNWALVRCAVPPEIPEIKEKFGEGASGEEQNGNLEIDVF